MIFKSFIPQNEILTQKVDFLLTIIIKINSFIWENAQKWRGNNKSRFQILEIPTMVFQKYTNVLEQRPHTKGLVTLF